MQLSTQTPFSDVVMIGLTILTLPLMCYLTYLATRALVRSRAKVVKDDALSSVKYDIPAATLFSVTKGLNLNKETTSSIASYIETIRFALDKDTARLKSLSDEAIEAYTLKLITETKIITIDRQVVPMLSTVMSNIIKDIREQTTQTMSDDVSRYVIIDIFISPLFNPYYGVYEPNIEFLPKSRFG